LCGSFPVLYYFSLFPNLIKLFNMGYISSLELGPGFGNVQLRCFDIPGSRIVNGNAFPIGLQLSSTSKDVLTAERAAEAIRHVAEKGHVTELLTKHGALLVRGIYDVSTKIFSTLIHASKESRGHVPYEQVGFSGGRTTLEKYIFSASEAPPHIKIYQHNEVRSIELLPWRQLTVPRMLSTIDSH
jgi:hypothetical protein